MTTEISANRAYLTALVKVYDDAMLTADSSAALKVWISQVFDGKEIINDLIAQIADTDDVLVTKNKITSFLEQLLVDFCKTQIADRELNPWDLAFYRSEMLAARFGPGSLTLPIQVAVGPNVYNHNMSYEFTAGLLLGLKDNKDIKIFFANQEFRENEKSFWENFLVAGKHQYSLKMNGQVFYFDTPQFLQGTNTAFKWMKKDQLTEISDLLQIDADGAFTVTLLND